MPSFNLCKKKKKKKISKNPQTERRYSRIEKLKTEIELGFDKRSIETLVRKQQNQTRRKKERQRNIIYLKEPWELRERESRERECVYKYYSKIERAARIKLQGVSWTLGRYGKRFDAEWIIDKF